MTRRTGLSTPGFALSIAIGIAIFILAMVVVGTRIDTGPPELPTPGADEVHRQEAADSYYLLAEASDEAAAGDTESDPSELASVASDHLDAVGGLWVPWPDGAPDGAENPPPPTATTDDLTVLLEDAITATQAALESGDPSDSPLYASILIRLQVAHDDIATAPEGEEPTGGISAEPLTSAQVAELASETSLVELDRARQWLEAAAPHLEAPDRALARIADLNDYTSEILDAGMDDIREPFAPLPDWFLEDPSAQTAAQLEADAYRLVATELFSYIPTATMSMNSQIAVTSLEFLTPSMRAEMGSFPLLEVAP